MVRFGNAGVWATAWILVGCSAHNGAPAVPSGVAGAVSVGGTSSLGGALGQGGNASVASSTSGGNGGNTGVLAHGGLSSGGRTSGGTSSGGADTTGSGGLAGGCSGHKGFWVDGRVLRDRCCEKVVLRGINEMVIWTGSRDGSPYFAEIAKTGANAVRIVWSTTGAAAQLDAAIKNAIAAQLIPIPELHDATGDMSKLTSCVDYWVRSDVVAVIQKYQDKVLVNIANEVGSTVTQAAFTTAYTTAITRMRGAGIHVPLVIDGSSWGQDINMLQATGPGLIAADPDRNLLFSVHMWWNDPQGSRVTTELNESVNMNLPLIVGEFAQHAVSNCSAEPFAYKTLMSLAKTLEVGWLAWSWGGVKNRDCASDGPFDMTTDGTFAGLTGWGLEVATKDANSIKNTSVRPRYMTSGSCN